MNEHREYTVAKSDDGLPGDWRDVSEKSNHRFHWHRGDGYPSIRMSNGGLGGYPGWEVEMYPDPRDGEEGVWRSTHDSVDEAGDRVTELMEGYPDE